MTTIEVEVTCPYCNSNDIVKNGKDAKRINRDFYAKISNVNTKLF